MTAPRPNVRRLGETQAALKRERAEPSEAGPPRLKPVPAPQRPSAPAAAPSPDRRHPAATHWALGLLASLRRLAIWAAGGLVTACLCAMAGFHFEMMVTQVDEARLASEAAARDGVAQQLIAWAEAEAARPLAKREPASGGAEFVTLGAKADAETFWTGVIGRPGDSVMASAYLASAPPALLYGPGFLAGLLAYVLGTAAGHFWFIAKGKQT